MLLNFFLHQMASLEPSVYLRLVHFPYNSLSKAEYLSLSDWIQIKLTSVSATLFATVVRAASKTVTFWKHALAELRDTDCCPFFSKSKLKHWRNMTFAPPLWKGPPIALTLEVAYIGFPDDKRIGEKLPDIICNTKNNVSKNPKLSLQREIYHNLAMTCFSKPLEQHFQRRARHLINENYVINDQVLQQLHILLKKLPPSWGIA